jgi:hypothetical protein
MGLTVELGLKTCDQTKCKNGGNSTVKRIVSPRKDWCKRENKKSFVETHPAATISDEISIFFLPLDCVSVSGLL